MEEDANKVLLPMAPPSGSVISLNMLLDFAVQRIFHEITVLSELLPKKLDADRKISLVQFAHSTRMLFVKLLALVKWVKSSKKFEACSSICYLLDLQSQYFIETADRLVALSREELVLARLPQFQISAAVDVLTQGTFSRLPICIKERFIKEKKITPREQAQVLMRLNQILQYRISRIAGTLSARIKEIRIKNGIVTLVVPGEFQVEVTVLGESSTTNWTLLNIKMLVEDYEIGYGTQLAHPLQLNMVHNILQSRMDVSPNPISEVYTFLHSFAQSLQLDVLFCQCSQLSEGRLKQKIVIEKYDVKERILTIGYWVQRIAHRKGSAHVRLVPQYRLTIYGSVTDDTSLKVRHFPNAPHLGQLDDRTGRLSIDRLLSETFAVRCRERLLRIRKRLEAAEPKALIGATGQATPCLCFPLLRDSCNNVQECLMISVCMSSGKVLCTLSALDASSSKKLRDLEKSLYDCHSVESLRKQLDRLKVLLMIERFRKSISGLQIRIINESQMAPFFAKLRTIPPDRVCLQFAKEEQYYLVVSFTPDSNLSFEHSLHLIDVVGESVQLLDLVPNLPHIAAPLMRVFKIDPNTHNVNAEEVDDWSPETKKIRVEESMERQLPIAVASVDDRISFMKVCLELDKKSIRYKSVMDEPSVGGLVLHITEASPTQDGKTSEFLQTLVRCCLRLDNRARIQWPFECCLVNAPILKDFRSPADANSVSCWVQEMVPTNNEGLASIIVERLTRYQYIYEIVAKFSKAYKAHYHKYCSVIAYTYHKLILAYGENRDQLMVLYCKATPPHDGFKLAFGQMLQRDPPDFNEVKWNSDVRCNAHSLMTSVLMHKFNKDKDLVELVHYLISTTVPINALSSFGRARFQSSKVIAQLLNAEVSYPIKMKCHLSPVNDSTVRLTYGSVHLEFAFLQDSQVAIRDSSRHRPRAAGLHQFFNLASNGEAYVMAVEEERPNSTPLEQRNPLSAPQIGSSPMVHTTGNLLSVPASSGMDCSPSRAKSPAQALKASNQPITISHDVLVKVCTFSEDSFGKSRSPLDDYLFALSYIERLAAAFDIYNRGNSQTMFSVPNLIKEMSTDQDHIKVTFIGIVPSSMAGDVTPLVTFHFHLDPLTMNLRLKLSYVDCEKPPSEAEIAIMEQYFIQFVVPLNNEFATAAFIHLCRLTPHGAAGNIAHIMKMQIDSTSVGSNSLVHIQLVYLSRDSNSLVRKYCCGVIVDNINSNALILIGFRSPKTTPNKSDRPTIVKLFYNLNTNSVKQQGSEDETISSILSSASANAAATGECPLFTAIRQFYERISCGLPLLSGNTPRPPSAGFSASSGNAASSGSMINQNLTGQGGGSTNPGSLMNTGSNSGL